MSRRVLIGSTTILSTDPSETVFSGSAPANATVRIWQHPDDQDYYRYLFDANGSAELRCRVKIEGDTAADAQTAYNTLAGILSGLKGSTVKFEYESGSKRWGLPDDFSEEFDVIAEATGSGKNIRVDVRFLAQGSAADPGSPTGAVTPLIWTLHFQPGGLCNARGTVTFKNKTTAMDWINDVEAGTSPPFPSWFGSDMKFYRWEPEFADKPDAYSGSQLFGITVEFRQMIGDLANHAALADLRDFGFNTVKHDGQPNTLRGPNPPLDVTISGNLQFKTEKLSDFRSGDSIDTTRTEVLESKADLAIDAIVQDVKDRMPFELHEIERKGDLDEKEGFYNFSVRCTMPEENKDEIMLIEKVRYRYESNTIRGERSDGSTKVWSSPAGMKVFLEHTITVRSFKRPRYRVPFVNDRTNWDSLGGETNDPSPERMLHRSGEVIWVLENTTHWQRNSKGEFDVIAPPSMGNTVEALELR